jgi:rubrerythrin
MVELCAALSEGIKLERESQAFYAGNAKAAKNGDVRALFKMLASEERSHEETLAAMSKGKTCPPGKKQRATAKAPKLGDSFSSEELEEYSTILLAAMAFEQKSRGFYDALALAAQDEEDKKTFASLAAFEQRHYDLLNALYEEINYYRLET